MSDLVRSYIRMAVPAALGVVASYLVIAVARSIGFELDGKVALGIVTALTITVLYGLGRALERSNYALLRGIGRFLLTLGPDLGQPIYVKDDPDTVRPLAKSPTWK